MEFQPRAKEIANQSDFNFETLAVSPSVDLKRDWEFPNLPKLIKQTLRSCDLASKEYQNAKNEIERVLETDDPENGLIEAMLSRNASKEDVLYRAVAICHFAEKGEKTAQEFVSDSISRTAARGMIHSKQRVNPNDLDDLVSVPLLAALRKIESLDPEGFQSRAADIFGRTERRFDSPPWKPGTPEELQQSVLDLVTGSQRGHEELMAKNLLSIMQFNLERSKRWGSVWSVGPVCYLTGFRTTPW